VSCSSNERKPRAGNGAGHFLHPAAGAIWSSSPAMTNTGTRIFPSNGVESGRSRSARSAPTIPRQAPARSLRALPLQLAAAARRSRERAAWARACRRRHVRRPAAPELPSRRDRVSPPRNRRVLWCCKELRLDAFRCRAEELENDVSPHRLAADNTCEVSGPSSSGEQIGRVLADGVSARRSRHARHSSTAQVRRDALPARQRRDLVTPERVIETGNRE